MNDTQKFSSKNKEEISQLIHTLLSVKGCNVKIARLRNSNIFTWKISINHSEYDARFRFSKQDRFDLRQTCRSFIRVPLSRNVKFRHGSQTVYIFTPIASYRRVDRHRIFVRRFRASFYAVSVVRSCMRMFSCSLAGVGAVLGYSGECLRGCGVCRAVGMD